MNIFQVKKEWNEGLIRYKKAEKLSIENPGKFEKYINNFNDLCRKMSFLMQEYEMLTGTNISENNFYNGF